MGQSDDTTWHFPIMIVASVMLFHIVIWIVLGKEEFRNSFRQIFLLSVLCVVIGMLFGKYGANWGLPWWVFYPVPMLVNVFLPPVILKMTFRQTILYLVLSFLSAPAIHLFFSLLFDWTEYMPFWKIQG
jgi:hypothetical protein